MKKHAYLIMAHTNFNQLQTLISILDDPRNDIYVHVDKRATKFNERYYVTKFSKLIFINRKAVNWGAYSQIDCEIRLLKAAKDSGITYSYYHLLSGLDFPIKDQNYIHSFFEKNEGKEFLDFDPKSDNNTFDRVKYYYFFQDFIGRNKGKIPGILYYLQERSITIQRKIGTKRKFTFPMYKGANWFSITNDLVTFVLQQKSNIRKRFRYTLCADEIVLQSIAMNSPYRQNIVNCSLREIDWTRGEPYTYRTGDLSILKASTALFARKFDESVDNNIISLLFKEISLS